MFKASKRKLKETQSWDAKLWGGNKNIYILFSRGNYEMRLVREMVTMERRERNKKTLQVVSLQGFSQD